MHFFLQKGGLLVCCTGTERERVWANTKGGRGAHRGAWRSSPESTEQQQVSLRCTHTHTAKKGSTCWMKQQQVRAARAASTRSLSLKHAAKIIERDLKKKKKTTTIFYLLLTSKKLMRKFSM